MRTPDDAERVAIESALSAFVRQDYFADLPDPQAACTFLKGCVQRAVRSGRGPQDPVRLGREAVRAVAQRTRYKALPPAARRGYWGRHSLLARFFPELIATSPAPFCPN